MRLRAILVTLLGILFGFFAALGVSQMGVRPEKVEQKVEVAVTKVLVIKKTIDRGKLLQAEFLELKDWPEKLVPDGALKKMEDAVGRIAMNKLIVGEPILEGKLVAPGMYRGAGNLVRPGMRAYTIVSANAASSVAGLILPGDHVDIILTVQSDLNDGSGGGTSTTLLQNVEILAIDRNLEAPEDRGTGVLTSVTLLVSQRQASLLGLGQKAGVMTMALRNPEDDDNALTEPVTLAQLRFREELPTVEPRPAAEPVVEPVSEPTPQTEIALDLPPARKKPKMTSIRTLRGFQPGVVSIQLDSGT